MKLITDTDKKEQLILSYDNNLKKYTLATSDSNDIIEYEPVINVEGTADLEQHMCYILHNSRTDYGENSIFEVKAQDDNNVLKRIGWIFPSQSLESREHDYYDNPFFLQYADVAIKFILSSDYEIEANEVCGIVHLSDILKMDETILVINKPATSSFKNFNIDDYIVSLFQHGYSFSGNGNRFKSCDIPEGKVIKLKTISSDLKHINYIVPLYRELLPVAIESVSVFMHLYQIVEMLISEVFNVEFISFVRELSPSIGTNLFEKKESLVEKTAERIRVKRLFSAYTKIPSSLVNSLKEACRILLTSHVEKIKDSAGDCLYDLRCLLVHRGYMLNKKEHEQLDVVNDAFIAVANEMIITFSSKCLCNPELQSIS